MKARLLIIVGCGLCAFGLPTGCGNSRTAVPSLSAPVSPGALRWISYPAFGVTIRAPRNWALSAGRPPLVTTITLTSSVAAVWSYPRHTGAPASVSALEHFRAALLSAARRRDPSLRVLATQLFAVDGFPAVQIDALEHVHGQPRRVRSLHVVTPTSEVVLDEYAPAGLFGTVDRTVFSQLERSLRVTPVSAG